MKRKTQNPLALDILDAVAASMRIGVRDIISSSRVAHIARARHLAAFLMRRLTAMSDGKIASAIGRERRTVIHSLRCVVGRPDDFEPHLSRILARFAEARS